MTGPQFLSGELVDEVTGPLDAAAVEQVRRHWLRLAIGWSATAPIGTA